MAVETDSSYPEALRRNGSFSVDVCPCCPCFADARKRLPAHRLVIEPLVARTHEMRVYGWDKTSTLCDEVLGLGRLKRGHVEVDLDREIVKGHERFWNTGSWDRGAIVLAATPSNDEIGNIFHWCSRPGVLTLLYQLRKISPASAIRYAHAIAAGGSTAFLFSASNGIQRMDVFASDAALVRLFAIAQEKCRPFKRYVEHNPGQDEIIVDRPPYIDLV